MIDTEEGSYIPLMGEETANVLRKKNVSNPEEEDNIFRLPGICNYVFQIIFQVHSLSKIYLLHLTGKQGTGSNNIRVQYLGCWDLCGCLQF